MRNGGLIGRATVVAAVVWCSVAAWPTPVAAELTAADPGRDAVQVSYSTYDLATGGTTLVLSTLDGGRETLLARTGFFIDRHEWSPDGLHLALVARSGADNRSHLYRLDVADRSVTQLSSDTVGAAGSAVWSPDGTEIAYSTVAGDVRIVGATGSADRLVTRAASYTGGADWDCGGQGVRLDVADWAPNGTELLLTASKVCFEYIRSDLAMVRTDGTGLRELVETGHDEEVPSFSPDGSRVLFGGLGVQTVNRDGTGLRHVVDGFWPSWSPAGAIAFSRPVYDMPDQSGIVDFEVWAADPTPRRVTPDLRNAQFPRWSPDSTTIVFIGNQGDVSGLYAVAAEGGPTHRVSGADAGNVGWFDLRPLPSAPVKASSARLAGTDRYATAAAIAADVQRQLPAPSAVALLARGDAFPDGLTASNLGTVPLLLTPRDTLHPATRQTLTELGIREVRIVGGVAAVSASVESELRQAGYAVTRVAGTDRYETAAATFDTTRTTRGIGTLDGRRTVIIASGQRFPDALAAGPVAAGARLPILLTTRDQLAGATTDALDRCASSCPEQAFIVGGTAAVGPLVETQLRARGLQVRRVAGDTRQGTAAALADLAVDELGWTADHVNVARGDTFPDALAAGPLGGVEQAPTLLTSSTVALGAPGRAFLRRNASTVTSLHVLGDATAVPRAPVLEARRSAS